MQDLTPRQSEIYQIIKRYIGEGRPPTLREIMKETGISSPNGVQCHLKALERKGWIIREGQEHQSRGLRLVPPSVEDVRVAAWDLEVGHFRFLVCNDELDTAPPSVLIWLNDILKQGENNGN